MAYDSDLADRVRNYLVQQTGYSFEEKPMFSGLAFLVNGKMCINISRDALMCRFDPERQDEVVERPGFRPMVMKGKEMAGYCYVDPAGFRSSRDFTWWMSLCLAYNERARSSKRGTKG